MFESFPPDVELSRDVSAADWILSSLQPWGPGGVTLGSFLPEGFEAYVRVFHPLLFGTHDSDDVQRTWAGVGAQHGVSLSPNVSLWEVLGIDAEEMERRYVRPVGQPADGELPEVVCEGLKAVLGPHTASQGDCWYCVWSGLGVFLPGAPLTMGGPSRKEMKAQRAAKKKAEGVLDSIPKVRAGHGRDHLLFRGPLSAGCSFGWVNPWVNPCLWWPDDRAWIVATEIDGICTYVGASRAAIDDILASDLETIEVTRDVFMS